MEFFDKIGKKASEAYKLTADKTGKMAKETKMKLKMGELKSKINDIYEDIGKRVYENHVREDDETYKEDVEAKCKEIDEINEEIENLLQQCLELKDMKQCKSCYTEIEKSAKFCHNCGEKQEENTQQENQDLENTVEIESNPDDKIELTDEEVMNVGIGEEDEDEIKDYEQYNNQ